VPRTSNGDELTHGWPRPGRGTVVHPRMRLRDLRADLAGRRRGGQPESEILSTGGMLTQARRDQGRATVLVATEIGWHQLLQAAPAVTSRPVNDRAACRYMNDGFTPPPCCDATHACVTGMDRGAGR